MRWNSAIGPQDLHRGREFPSALQSHLKEIQDKLVFHRQCWLASMVAFCIYIMEWKSIRKMEFIVEKNGKRIVKQDAINAGKDPGI